MAVISEQTIRAAVERMVTSARPSRIILFGSYARGTPDEGSDIDFLVIAPQLGDRYQEMIRLRDAVGPIGAGEPTT